MRQGTKVLPSLLLLLLQLEMQYKNKTKIVRYEKGTNSCLAKTQKKRAVAIVVLRRQPQEKGNPEIAGLFEIGEQRMRF